MQNDDTLFSFFLVLNVNNDLVVIKIFTLVRICPNCRYIILSQFCAAFQKQNRIIKRINDKCYDKQFQNVLFHAPDCSHQERTRTNRYTRHSHSLLRSFGRTGISDDHLQRKPQSTDRTSTRCRRPANGKSLFTPLRNPMRHIHPPE